MIKVLYGTEDVAKDITAILYQKCVKINNDGKMVVYIPHGDLERAKIFGDPIVGIVKKIYIYEKNKLLRVLNRFQSYKMEVIPDLECIHQESLQTKQMFYGECFDGVYIDNALREYFPDFNYKGVFFDIGAYDPKLISNSHHFYINGWDVYCFEANPQNVASLKKERDYVFHYAVTNKDEDEPMPFQVVYTDRDYTCSYSSIKVSEKYKEIAGWKDYFRVETIHVPQKTLQTIIDNEIPELTHIDIMSIDVEGFEINVLKGANLNKYSPSVIIVENLDDSDTSIHDYMLNFGYRLDRCVHYNYIYTLQSFKTPTFTPS